jgi:hypothetical protein
MRSTGSIRTATPWRWSSTALFLGLVASGCVHQTNTYYKPTAGDPRLSQDEVRDQSDDVLKIECPRLMGGHQSATGEARIRVEYDRSGAVQQAQITRASNDPQIDTVWGALAARLKFDAQAGQTEELKPAILTFGYSCSPTVAITTLQIPQ